MPFAVLAIVLAAAARGDAYRRAAGRLPQSLAGFGALLDE
jgi:hypothetical protein